MSIPECVEDFVVALDDKLPHGITARLQPAQKTTREKELFNIILTNTQNGGILQVYELYQVHKGDWYWCKIAG